jgi:hypothetical protein
VVHPKASSVSQCFFSSNGIEILLVLPENESHQQKGAFSLADLGFFVKKRIIKKFSFYSL